jgi:hypothetical protein
VPAAPPPAPSPEEIQRRVARRAALSLLAFSVLTMLMLAAWFGRVAQPWSWRSTLAILCAALGLLASVVVWRIPSRQTALGGVGVMVLSLLRVGLPEDFTWSSFALVVITTLLLVPVVRAAIALKWRA